MKIALLGAESTGKTQLAIELAASLRRQGKTATAVPEFLREWCEREGRAPRPEEQLPIAREHEARVDAAAAVSDIVIADTTALMVAIYGAILYEDSELFQFAIARQREYNITLLTGLDLPWVADGLHREGPHVREPVDALVRQELERAIIGYRVIYGTGEQRVLNALAAMDSSTAGAGSPANARATRQRPWTWQCDKCSDPECEHRLFTSLR